MRIITNFLDFSLFAALSLSVKRKRIFSMNNLSQAFSFQTFLKLDFQFDEPLLKDQNKEKPEIHSISGLAQI